jgi:N-acetylmuramoyl-L-alanine amidase
MSGSRAALAQSPEPTTPGWGVTIIPRSAKSRPPAAPEPSAAPAPAPPTSPLPQARIATAVSLTGDATRTRITFDLTAPVAFTVFRMTDPFRVVLDLDDLAFRLPQGSGRQSRGLIIAFRYGLFAPGKARIVIDTEGPTRIEAARMTPATATTPDRLEIDLVPSTATEVAAAELASAAQSIELKPRDAAPPVDPPKSRGRPVVVIDPGHGGIDPGAQGTRWLEKDIVLAVAREIRRSLLSSRRYEVVMTRSGDTFVSLDQRVKISRQHHADLFISIHADSLAQRELAQSIRGATIYTLSERASDDLARRRAEKENAADLLAGLASNAAVADDQVRDILLDLMRRETSNLAHDFRAQLVRDLRPRLALAKEPARSGPFKVLRQPGSPAVLIELGYISNAEDERQMSSEAWQRGVGEAVARAADEYLSRQSARRE